ncbi:MAG: beta-N-acetylglucosaminidase domain-containing protein [Acidobacteriia bacterium]|nr:beta-N-acetylglucosaminidase domain-containing protein [Terriglobia bacterium]
MRGRLVLVVVSVVTLFTPLAAGRTKAVWTVVSSSEIDSRIQRQLRELASQNGVPLRFSGDVARNTGPQRDAGDLRIQLDSVADPSAFLAELEREARGSEVEPTAELANEGYILYCSYSRGPRPNGIRIQAASATGLHNALLKIPDLLATGASNLSTGLVPRPQSVRLQENGAEAMIADYPSFPIRGMVEGFYGPPWSHADRLEVLRFEGQHGMNIYIYGPKDDPYHRKLWREPYPPEQLKRMGELADTARENFVDLSFAISPGLSMIYSSDSDFQTLAHKLESVGKLGISSFALFLDDVPQDLVHPEDKARFRTLARAHVQLINRLYDHLKSLSPKNRLTVCPTTYTNEWGNRDYIRELGAGVNPEIPLDWTGTEVIPQAITAAQAEEWGDYIRRKPLVWDNYPTNDSNPWWLNLDPLRRREAGLSAATQGLFSNPMYQAHATLIPLQTVADYLWNPRAYDPEKSQMHALVSQYGQNAPALFAPLLRIFTANRGDGWIFRSIFEESWTPVDVPAIESQVSRLSSSIAALRGQRGFEKLVSEISPLPDILRDQLARIRTDAAFKHLPDGKIQWDRERDILKASRVFGKPVLDGDFSKWESGTLYLLNKNSQIVDGKDLWKGPSQFSARVALAWDEENLYFGVDVTDPQLYQPFWGRGVQNGDAFRLIVDTILPIAMKPGRPTGVFDLYLSPGNFADVKPSVYCNEDFFPLRSRPHDYNQEIRATWKKTATGFSGDVVVPATFFARQNFALGQEIGLSFGAQKVFLPKDPFEEDPARIFFSSKEGGLFPVESQSPATFQRMDLVDP